MAWHEAANDSDLSEGEILGVAIAGTNIALYRLDGAIFATSNVCSHEFAFLSDGFFENGYIECPLHSARFDVKTGEVLCAPATEPIATYPVRLEGGKILVQLTN
jgi:apoptosis-inducing factor 3